MNEPALESLRARLGDTIFKRRMAVQACTEVPLFGRSSFMIRESHLWQLRKIIAWGVKAAGLYERGKRNVHHITLREHPLAFPGLPAPFIGTRMLHLSDLHLLDRPGPADNIIECLRNASYDIAVITGDCCEETYGDNPAAVDLLRRVIRHLHPPVYACLGNHDLLELTLTLEDLGVRVLLNEHTIIEKSGARLAIAGIDDPHVYRTADVPRALAGIPRDAFTILLAHSAEVYREAAAGDVRLMLCGHTHGGQICLPGGIPFFYSARTPRSMVNGLWRYGPMLGYTSPGLGASMVPVRLWCPPEAIIHMLDRA